MNQVQLIGNLVRDAELKQTTNGYSLCKISIAVNSRVKQGDQWVDRPDFFDMTLWGKRAESLAQYLKKGGKVGIVGTLRQNRWQTNEGQSRSKVEINVDDIDLLGGKPNTENQGPSTYEANDGDFQDDIPWNEGGKDDSIPF